MSRRLQEGQRVRLGASYRCAAELTGRLVGEAGLLAVDLDVVCAGGHSLHFLEVDHAVRGVEVPGEVDIIAEAPR